jgi:hypothetical protein
VNAYICLDRLALIKHHSMQKIISFLLVTGILASCASRLTADKKSQLAKRLKEMVIIDQVAANIPTGQYKEYSKERWEQFKDSVFTADKNEVESIFTQYGFPGFDKVGEEGSQHFWLIVQHCDKYPAFQKKVLNAMEKEVKKHNANPNNYAYLYDRVKVNAGEKQLFGTQVTYEVATTGRAIPKIGLIDSANVDKLRKDYNLDPLKDYLNMMTTMHYEMNKNTYQQKGIMSPQLYD